MGALLSCSVVSDSETPWTIAHQAPLFMGILQARTLRVGCHALLLGIFPTQGSNPVLPHCRRILYHERYQGSPRILEWVHYSFSRVSSRPRNWTGGLMHCRWILYQLSYQGSPTYLSLWNYPAHKKLAIPYIRASCLLRRPTLSVECASSRATLVFWDRWHSVYGIHISLNKSPSYHFASSWIPSVVRHNLSFTKFWDQVCDFN